MTRPAALEFSFLVSIPIMIAGTGYATVKTVHPSHKHAADADESLTPLVMTSHLWVVLMIGLVVSFIVALGVVEWFWSGCVGTDLRYLLFIGLFGIALLLFGARLVWVYSEVVRSIPLEGLSPKFRPSAMPRSGIIVLLWGSGLCQPSVRRAPHCALMKPLKLVTTPTRNRRLNELVGLLVLASAVLLFLSLVSYRPTDPSLNTTGASRRPSRNWIGPAGAYISDLLLQIEGLHLYPAHPSRLLLAGRGCALVPPVRPVKNIGVVLSLLFAPALFGLIPSHPLSLRTARRGPHRPPRRRSSRALPQLSRRVHRHRHPGGPAIYLSTTFSFNTAREWLAFARLPPRLARPFSTGGQPRPESRAQSRRALDRIHEKDLKKARKAAAKAGKASAE